ncbi:MAG: hypothetical protein KF861_09890 [Planctomycetaceae bacterium]|nr:hypothetical protein [Planctomycetaceae bacterium]
MKRIPEPMHGFPSQYADSAVSVYVETSIVLKFTGHTEVAIEPAAAQKLIHELQAALARLPLETESA